MINHRQLEFPFVDLFDTLRDVLNRNCCRESEKDCDQYILELLLKEYEPR